MLKHINICVTSAQHVLRRKCCIIALLHNFLSELIFLGKNIQRNNPSKITKILGDTGVEYNYI